MSVLYSLAFLMRRGKGQMETIKEKIEKLLRLAMSDNPHEAKLAAERAIALMHKYAISQEEVGEDKLISQTFYLEYARIPVWIRELYSGLSHINGCYMVWVDGHRDVWGDVLEQKSKIILTGRESDVLNTEYFLHIFIREIEKRSALYSEKLGKHPNKRSYLRAYRLGLGKGLIGRMYEAMKHHKRKVKGEKSNLPIFKDSRYDEAKAFYLSKNKVQSVQTKIKKNLSYYSGLMDAQEVDIHRPVCSEEQTIMLPG